MNFNCLFYFQGEQQWVLISFEDSVELSAIEIQFQGGFCAPKFHLEAGPDSKNLKSYDDFYPDITNSKQTFLLSAKIKEKVFKIVFDGSSDFFGRITVYSLDLLCSAAGWFIDKTEKLFYTFVNKKLLNFIHIVHNLQIKYYTFTKISAYISILFLSYLRKI